MQETRVMNGLIRIDGISEDASDPFEAPFRGKDHDDFHVLEMAQYVPSSVVEFINTAIAQFEKHKHQFDMYRKLGCKITLHVAIQHGDDAVTISPAQMGKLSHENAFLEVVEY